MSTVFLDIAGLSGQGFRRCNSNFRAVLAILLWSGRGMGCYEEFWSLLQSPEDPPLEMRGAFSETRRHVLLGCAGPSPKPDGTFSWDAQHLLRKPTARSLEVLGIFSEVRRRPRRRFHFRTNLVRTRANRFQSHDYRWPVAFSYGASYPLDSLRISC